MREQALLAHIAKTTPIHPLVTVGPGDDCAVVAPFTDAPTLVTTDQVIEGRHFRTGEDLTLVARKAVCRSLSDIAAMAGTPRWAVATGALPKSMTQVDAQRLTDALHATANAFNCPIVGGDIATTDGPMVLTVTIAGTPHPTRGPVLRSGARPGDRVYVTGALGGSLPSRRHLTFTPRLNEAYWLATLLRSDLTSMMDLSDGLGLDAARLATASDVTVVISAASLPRHEHVATWQAAMSDGEDYELLFTASQAAPVPDRCPLTGTPITRIGMVVAYVQNPPSPRCAVKDLAAGALIDASTMGWEHAS